MKFTSAAILALSLTACDSPTKEVVVETCTPGQPDYVSYVDGDSGLSAEWAKLSGGKMFANKAEYGKWHSEQFANEGRVIPICK